MKRPVTILVAATLLAAALPAQASPREPASRIEASVAALQARGFSGQIVVGDEGSVVFDTTIGLAQTAPLWIWGSVSKQVTAALVASEVDRGNLKFEDIVATRLPGFRDPQGRRATVRQLLQHTSGLPNPYAGVAEGQVPAFFLRQGEALGGVADAVGFCAGPPVGEPGRFSYNNCDTIVAGAILERATGRSFAELLEERITKPLGMATVRLARSGERLPIGASQGSATPTNIAAYGPAAAIIGSARDLMLFSQALMNGRLVSAASRATMWEGDPKLGYAALGAWSFSAPLKGCQAPTKLIERRGHVDGVQARNIIAPELKRALVMFTPSPEFDFGEIWRGQGASYEIASAAFCGAEQVRVAGAGARS
ncbi:MAG TPA: serine hydrolase domain-containing protein [Sphingomonadaceae bacterium]|nr:serine hydrolase domain-containing protein [Sphingomonadaceae bacterium]